MGESVYTPSPWQQRFHSCPYHEVLGAGAAGPGKTIALIMNPTDQIVLEHERMVNPEHPYRIVKGQSLGHALFLRREASMLQESILRAKRMYRVLDPGVKWTADNSGGGTFLFSSGYRRMFGHCKDPDDWEKYLGWEFTEIDYDELTQFLQEQYEQINTRLRTSDPLLMTMLRIRAMSNPMMRRPTTANFVMRDPHWVRRYFVDPAPNGNMRLYREVTLDSGEVIQRDRIYLPARLSDNPDKVFVKNYELELQSAPPHIRAALLRGNWYITADSFYAWTWSPSIHVRKGHRIPRHWRIFRSMDWGFKLPGTVGYWALDDDDHLIKFKEINFQGKTDLDVAGILKEYEIRMKFWGPQGSLLTGPADTQIWEQRGGSGGGFAKTKAQVFLEKGFQWVAANKKRRQDNAQLLLKRLSDHGDRSGLPGIMFFENCEQTIKTLPGIPTDPQNSECPLDGGEDHWHDEVLYACEYASRGPEFLRPFEEDEDNPAATVGLDMKNYGYG